MCGEGAHGEVATFQPRRESVATAVDRQLVNKILDDYFYRQGLFEAGDCLVKKGRSREVEVEIKTRYPFLEFHRITESLKLRSIEPAMGCRY